jgi:nucleoside-diphosphate-sugar epimerase
MTLFIFGLGYMAQRLAARREAAGDRVFGTVRSPARAAALTGPGVTVRAFGDGADDPAIAVDLAQSDAVLISVPPTAAGDPVLSKYAQALRSAPHLRWIGYLSTIGVYGDHRGGWVDETTPVRPGGDRSVWRAAAERAWLDFGVASGVPVHLFRLEPARATGAGPRAPRRQAGPGVQPHPCRGYRQRGRGLDGAPAPGRDLQRDRQ